MSITVKELAKELHTDPPTARRFLRIISPDERPEKGKRWNIEENEIATLKNKFTAFHSARNGNDELVDLLHSAQHNLEMLEERLEALR